MGKDYNRTARAKIIKIGNGDSYRKKIALKVEMQRFRYYKNKQINIYPLIGTMLFKNRQRFCLM